MIFERDNWQEIFATIRKNKLRTFLTALGVFWGIFMLVVMLGAGNGLRNGITKDFAGTATNSFFCWAQTTSKAYNGLKAGRRYNFDNEDTRALKTKMPELAVVAPMNQLGGYEGSNSVFREGKNGAFSIFGVVPDILKIQQIKIKSGRFINDNDIKDNRKVTVIGKRVVELLFGKEDPLGKYVRINGVYFMVIGVIKPSGNEWQEREQSEAVYTPFTTFQAAFNYGNKVGWYSIAAVPGITAEAAEAKTIAFLKKRHDIAPEDKTAVGHWNMGQEFNKISGLFLGIESLIWVVGIGTLLAGVIGVSNIMLIIVKERTKEIGIKRAIGATPYNVVSQLLTESVFLTTFAGYFGLVAGIGILELISGAIGEGTQMFSRPEVDMNVALTALFILIISGLFAGLYPSLKAVSIAPVEALRAE